MQLKPTTVLVLLLFFISSSGFSQQSDIHLYKQTDTVRLYIEVLKPANFDKSKTYPAIVFFFGGGWKNGDRNHFRPQAEYFSQRELVCFLVDYRTESKHKTTPFESLKDAKSAMRYIRANAKTFNIDPGKIIGAGGSAGGHLAAATALVEGYNESSDDTSISCKPNALVLFNPVFDNGPGGYGFERIGDEYKDFSPLHNIKKGAPPTLLLFGSEDPLVPVETIKYYQKVMQKVGSICEAKIYKGEKHGFFNYGNFKNYKATILQADAFLSSIGYLSGKPLKINKK